MCQNVYRRFTSAPVISIQIPALYRFGYVLSGDVLGVVEVRNRPCYSQQAVMRPRGPAPMSPHPFCRASLYTAQPALQYVSRCGRATLDDTRRAAALARVIAVEPAGARIQILVRNSKLRSGCLSP